MKRAFLVILLLSPALIAAFGAGPSSVSLTPDDDSYTLRILNSEREALDLTLYAEGAVARFIDLPVSEVSLQPTDNEVLVPVRLNVPDDVLPGEYAGGVVIEQEVSQQTGGFVRAVPSVKQYVSVTIPRSGVFLDADLLLSAPAVDEDVLLTASLSAVGTLDVADVTVRVEVVDAAGQTVFSERRSVERVPVGEARSVSFRWRPSVVGDYQARLVASYSSRSVEVERSFRVGALSLTVGDPVLGDAPLGEVLRIGYPLSSAWNARVAGVAANLSAIDEDGLVVSEFTSLSASVPPQGDAELVAYWNTAGLSPGRYTLAADVHYAGRSARVVTPVVLGVDAVRVAGEGVPVWAWLLVLVVLVGLVWGAQRLIRSRR